MEELRPGLSTWTAPHPEWTPKSGGPNGWERDVRCYAVDTVLIDPLEPPEELVGRATAVVLTIWYHERSAVGLGLPIHAPAPDIERVAGAEPYEAGDDLPGGIEAVASFDPDEPVLWIPAHRALVVGDVLLGDDKGGIRLEPQSWMPKGTTSADAAAGLRHLLELPIELLLPTHGDPVLDGAHDRLREALS